MPVLFSGPFLIHTFSPTLSQMHVVVYSCIHLTYLFSHVLCSVCWPLVGPQDTEVYAQHQIFSYMVVVVSNCIDWLRVSSCSELALGSCNIKTSSKCICCGGGRSHQRYELHLAHYAKVTLKWLFDQFTRNVVPGDTNDLSMSY